MPMSPDPPQARAPSARLSCSEREHEALTNEASTLCHLETEPHHC